MTTRYRLLPNFPQHITREVKSRCESIIKSLGIENISNDLSTIQSKLTLKSVPVVIDSEHFADDVILMITKPNSGMGQPHTDKSRHFTINIPIQVEASKGYYIAGIYDSLSEYPKPNVVLLDNKQSCSWDYDESYYENVEMSCPIFINTSLPHSWTNMSDSYRVVAGLRFKTNDLTEAENIIKEWT